MTSINAIVCAAGFSIRMGGEDKLLMPFRDTTILGATVENLVSSGVKKVIIVPNERSFGVVKSILSDQKIDIRVNHKPERGMTSSIQIGVEASNSDVDGYMICMGDQPLIPTAIYDQLIYAFGQHLSRNNRSIVAPTFQGKRGNPVIFSQYYYPAIQNHEDPEGCKVIVDRNTDHLTLIPVLSDSIFRDVDTPEDYQKITTEVKKDPGI